MNTQRKLPGWMYASEEPESQFSSSSPALPGTPHPLIHLLPRLKEYLSIVDPDRVDRAMELLICCQSEEELFSDLQTQYGDLPVSSNGESIQRNDVTEKPPVTKRARSSAKQTDDRISKAPRNIGSEDGELSDFIVPDSEADEKGVEGEEEEEEDEEEESEFSESESEIDEPEPEDLSRRKLLSPSKPVPSSPPTRPPMPTRPSDGPTVLCKYGKSCYRKNPVHFKEFAHPWLLNQPGDI